MICALLQERIGFFVRIVDGFVIEFALCLAPKRILLRCGQGSRLRNSHNEDHRRLVQLLPQAGVIVG
jgi:hypothetical protein